MSLKARLKEAVETLTRTHIYRALPRGVELRADLARALPRFQPQVIFDVGANIGQSAQEFVRIFPAARVYCFEPVQATFDTLEKNLSGIEGVRLFHLGLGAGAGPATMVLEGPCERHHLRAPVAGDEPATARTESVRLQTVDLFCRENAINRIGFLKIDTEGADLEVLRGAEAMLAGQKIDMVQVEAGMNPDNTLHVPFGLLHAHLTERSYLLFGLYEQVPAWPTRQPHLRRTNPVYISAQVIEASR